MILGGGSLTSYSSSRAWGVNPSAASGTVVMDNTGGGSGVFSLAVGDYIVYSFDALASFYGIVTEIGEAIPDPTQGVSQTFSVLDNRIRLQWQTVYGAWNMEDEMLSKRLGRPNAPSAPGDSSSNGTESVTIGGSVEGASSVEAASSFTSPGDAGATRRRYWSILPQHWAAGIRTWHDEPFTARQILNFAFSGAWGDFGFTRNYHSALDSCILTNVDHTSGIKLSNLIAEINDKAGLEITISGSRTLVWARKGDGVPPLPDDYSDGLNTGSALTANDTGVRVVGEKIRVQVVNVELEPDWKPGWEKFIDELAWHREIAEEYAMPTVTAADQADIAALAKKVTVYQYAAKKGDPTLLDYRFYGQISRVNMSAWMYIQELVFRSYRIPPEKTLYGIPISSLEMADSLLCNTDINGEGEEAVQDYVSNPVEYYPAAQAQVIVKGQPLDAIDSRQIGLIYRNAATDLRNEWTVATDFEVDPIHMSVRFSAPLFMDGLPAEGKSIYLKLNKGEGGGTDVTSLVGAGSEYLNVIVPNPACEITAASVKASFCFLLGRYHRDFGTGPRRGTLSVPGLGLHLLDTKGTGSFTDPGTASFNAADLTVPETTGSTFREILYEDGGKAIEKATAAAESVTSLSAVQATGGFKRNGVAGTALTGVVDRITVNITAGGGLTEEVAYTKARATTAALAEKTLQRIQRSAELFPGQEALKTEIRQYRLLAKALRGGRKGSKSATHSRFEDLFRKPVGTESVSTRVLFDKNAAAPTRGSVQEWRAGDIVWVDASGNPSATGTAFGGVLVSKPAMVGEGEEAVQSKELMVATQGIVPVRLRGVVPGGSPVSADKGHHYGGASGEAPIGTLMHGEDSPDPGSDAEVLAMVNLGFGGGGSAAPTVIPPLTIVSSRPSYIPEPPAIAPAHARFYVTWGTVNGIVASNWTNCVDVPLAADITKYILMKATFAPAPADAAELEVASAEWIVADNLNAPNKTPAWGEDGTRPEFCIIHLGQINVIDGVASAFNISGGSILLSDYVHDIASDETGGVTFKKRLAHVRLPY